MESNKSKAERQADSMFPRGSKNWNIAYECILDSLNPETPNGEYIHEYSKERTYTLEEMRLAFDRGASWGITDEPTFDEFLKTL